MISFKSFEQKLFRLKPSEFKSLALDAFRYQAANNSVYQNYLGHLNITVNNVKNLEEIPFMPISFFKNHIITTGKWKTETIFGSSGTTGQERSRHFIKNLQFYNKVTHHIFKKVYGHLGQYNILALLPSYLERNDSSLIYMVNDFIKHGKPDSGFYLDDYKALIDKIAEIKEKGEPIILLGVSFALLDLAEKYEIDLKGIIVMETGGMKGRRKELVRSELHQLLKKSLNVNAIHSEYGMTELMSQAYSQENGVFKTPTWMKIITRDLNDPFDIGATKKIGGINVIDLANIHSCCFIETQDMGVVSEDGSFEVLGRIDNSEIRGCNLLVASN